MMNGNAGLPRCVVYGTGFVGTALTRLIVERGWTIAGAYNRSGDKVGQDLGRISGLSRDLGIIVEDCETANYASLEADVALIATTNSLAENLSAYRRFFQAGINVLCHGTESYHPYWINTELAREIDAMAKRFGVTFTGGGIWDNTRIWSGILAAGPCVEIESMTLKSQTEAIRQGLYWADILGVGLEEKAFRQKMEASKGGWGKTLQIPLVSVVQKLGCTVEDVVDGYEPVIRDHDFYCAPLNRTIHAGTALGVRFLVDLTTRQGLTARTENETRVFEEGEIEEMRWIVKGRPRSEVRYVREDSGIASASSLLNRVPDVIAAGPGIVEITKYGPLMPFLN